MHGDGSALCLGDRLHDREPQAGAGAPAGAFGLREPVEEPGLRVLRDPGPAVRDSHDHPPAVAPRRDPDRRPRWSVPNGVADELIQCVTNASRVEQCRHVVGPAELDGRAGQRPARAYLHHQIADRCRGRVHEVSVGGRGQLPEPGGDPRKPVQFVDDHLSVMPDDVVGRAADPLGMPQRGRKHGLEPVGDIIDEPPLGAQQREVAFPAPADLFPGSDTTASVEDHRAEDGGHQRDLGQLLSLPVTGPDVVHQRDSAHEHDGGECDGRDGQVPDPPAVEQREADPDEVEGHRGPRAEHPDRGRIGHDGQAPGDLDPVPLGECRHRPSQDPPRTRCGVRSRWRPPPAWSSAAAHRRRRRWILAGSCSPTRPRAGAPWRRRDPRSA